MSQEHLRFHTSLLHLGSPFGAGAFGRLAETTARFLGTPYYLVVQTSLVIGWILLNGVDVASFDPYPFILLNLAFSTQAAYAAPLILLAETRQADRDKAWSAADAQHREQLAETTLQLLEQNTELTRQVRELSDQIAGLTRHIHQRVVEGGQDHLAGAPGV
jgi:uncharacterized membrane protein